MVERWNYGCFLLKQETFRPKDGFRHEKYFIFLDHVLYLTEKQQRKYEITR